MLAFAMYLTNSVGAVDQKDSVGSWVSFGYKSEILGGEQDWIQRSLFYIKGKSNKKHLAQP